MDTKGQNCENLSVNEILSDDKQMQSSSHQPGSSLASQKKKSKFSVLLTCGDLVLPFAKYAAAIRRKTISRVFAKKECKILAGKLYMPWESQMAVITMLIF